MIHATRHRGEHGMRRTVACRWLAAAALTVLGNGASAGSIYPNAPSPTIAIEQRLGAQLPLGVAFTNADGRIVHLGDFFAASASTSTSTSTSTSANANANANANASASASAVASAIAIARATEAARSHAVPVVLVLGYFHCTNLCETVMQTTLDALAQSGASRAAFRIVAVSIDPAETAADAHARRARDLADAELAWARAARGRAPSTPLDLQALVGAPAAVDLLAERAGFGFQRIGTDAGDPREVHSAATFVHAAGILVATPRGRIARYFLGVRPDPAALRVALDDAADESIGDFADRLVLLCAHLDPTLGRFSTAVLGMLRVLGVGLAGALGVWIWRHRRIEPAGRPS